MRPRTLDEVVGQREHHRSQRDAAPRARRGQAAQPHPLGPARHRQDDDRAGDRARERRGLRVDQRGHRRDRRPAQGHRPREGTARAGQATLFFIDEIARWSKSQQDALLPHVEDGTITLIGATTEHPGHEIVRALRSRLKIYTLTPHTDEDLREIIRRALARPRARPRLGPLRAADRARAGPAAGARRRRRPHRAQRAPGRRHHAARRRGDRRAAPHGRHGCPAGHLQPQGRVLLIISALIKSIRGSDTDASLYWLARLKHGGADPKVVARRLIVAAGEEIGTAAPGAIAIANSGSTPSSASARRSAGFRWRRSRATSRSPPRAGRPTTGSRRRRRSSRPRPPTRSRRSCATRSPRWTSSSGPARATSTPPSPAATASSSCRTRCADASCTGPQGRAETDPETKIGVELGVTPDVRGALTQQYAGHAHDSTTDGAAGPGFTAGTACRSPQTRRPLRGRARRAPR